MSIQYLQTKKLKTFHSATTLSLQAQGSFQLKDLGDEFAANYSYPRAPVLLFPFKKLISRLGQGLREERVFYCEDVVVGKCLKRM